MSKRRSIHRKADPQKSSHRSNIPSFPSDPFNCEVPRSIKILQYFEHILEPTLYTKPTSIAYFCFSVTLILSLFSNYFPFIRYYAIAKDSFLNVYFVKNGWGWTLLVVGSYIIYSSVVCTLMELKLITKHLGRLIVCTALWYSFTNLFDIIQETTGFCTDDKFKTPQSCKREDFEWIGFDVSGHCFLLTFCLLILVEEYKTSKLVYWDSLTSSFDNKSSNNKLSTLLYELSPILVPVLKLAALALLFIWQWMLITSALFYHSPSEALIGTVCGLLSWWSTYVLCFHPQKYLTYPGDGDLAGHFKEFSNLK